MANKLSSRFSELVKEANDIEAKRTKWHDSFTNSNKERVDRSHLLTWQTKAKHLIVTACGETSEHYKSFEKAEHSTWSTNLDDLRRMRAVFLAAQADYDDGLVSGLRSLVQAEVFESELEQASELLRSRYKVPAAVIAGTVLETHLRELCTAANLPHGKADKMNADLAKAGKYNSLAAKRVTALLSIRNSAAHGKADEFSEDDVKAMIEEIERFLAQLS